ncbi:Winged helix-turn-helix DNA-binding [Tindallia magadiensis]|uniref:Winged helix-turn-helix DNA-binding n=1 Tax=Tindallia magadiensis TaxID=69895 RepID=A0A1I3D2E8_9FIRM|nr:winged helix-turn-helix transcriptional regulator [Tindallia magadiensis]SFH80930.1 Winged helix-turn-helix DNA-binding [Tindallia magadiensis]
MSMTHDKEYAILTQLDANPQASQRDISRQTGFSLGSVNLLLKKMINRGLVKMEEIPANRVAYMLTPAGMVEKAQKTVKYVKIHYKAIDETKEHFKNLLSNLIEQHHTCYLLTEENEIGHLIRTAAEELHTDQILIINQINQITQPTIPVVHCVDEPKEQQALSQLPNKLISLLE